MLQLFQCLSWHLQLPWLQVWCGDWHVLECALWTLVSAVGAGSVGHLCLLNYMPISLSLGVYHPNVEIGSSTVIWPYIWPMVEYLSHWSYSLRSFLWMLGIAAIIWLILLDMDTSWGQCSCSIVSYHHVWAAVYNNPNIGNSFALILDLLTRVLLEHYSRFEIFCAQLSKLFTPIYWYFF